MDTADQKIENRKAQLQKEERALNEIKDKVYAGFSKERAASMGSPVDSTARRGTRTRQAAMPHWDAKVQNAQLERGRMQEEEERMRKEGQELGTQSIDPYEGRSAAVCSEQRQRAEKLNSLGRMVCTPTRRSLASSFP